MTTATLQTPLTKNPAVLKWVEECAAFLKPSNIRWLDGTEAEKNN